MAPEAYLGADDVTRDRFRRVSPDGLQHLDFLVANGVGIEGRGRLEGHERGELQDVALNHVTQGTGGFIKCGALLDAQTFRSGDLHVIHIITVPERLENAVPEAQHQQVLHRVLAEVVVDAIDLRYLSKTCSTAWLSLRAEARSRPNGFSMIMRTQDLPLELCAR